jgi:light-regulated signal transduction histidine kinase (bacteriophytochrome)
MAAGGLAQCGSLVAVLAMSDMREPGKPVAGVPLVPVVPALAATVPVADAAVSMPPPAVTCDDEPIRIPGAIQPHGYLVSFNDKLEIVQTSANVSELTGAPPEALLGARLDTLVGAQGAALISDVLRGTPVEDEPLYVGRVAWQPDSAVTLMNDAGSGLSTVTEEGAADAATNGSESDTERTRGKQGERMLDLLLHSHAGILFLEIEPTTHAGNVFSPIYALVRTFVSRLQSARTVMQLSELAAREVKAITGYGRVLVYGFDEDGNGHVIAEERDAGYASYLNQFFPPSDIPKQARALYLRQHIRLIADVDYTPSVLIPSCHPATGEPTDLSFAALRSVSPVHLEYMRNMGTASSMSISIIVRGKLWGLISCHHHTPRQVNFEARAACEHLGEVLSLQIEAKEDVAEADYRLELRRMHVDLISSMSDRDDFVDSVVSSPHALLKFMSAHGAAVVFDGRTVKVGETPDDEAIAQLVERIATSSSREVFHTDALSQWMPEAAPYASQVSGVLAVQISKLHRHFILWFRPEVVRTIEWAGQPTKEDRPRHDAAGGAAAGGGVDLGAASRTDPESRQEAALEGGTSARPSRGLDLSPRKSFEIWREIVRNRSRRWRASEVGIAREFRASVLGIVLRRAEEMALIAAELGRVNKELEAFSYSVSHDLRAPLRHIVGYGDLLREYEGERLTERGGRYLRNIMDSARFAGVLVDDLLTFSQMGRAALRPAPVMLRSLFDAVIRELQSDHPDRAIDWDLGELPTVTGDAAFLILVVRNLLSNAVKYTQHRPQAYIVVRSEETPTEYVVSVNDNGVGFNMRYVHKLFGVFQRLHRVEDFEGTGIGLANVRRIVERHDGRTWAEGEPDKGATFYFSLPKKISHA